MAAYMVKNLLGLEDGQESTVPNVVVNSKCKLPDEKGRRTVILLQIPHSYTDDQIMLFLEYGGQQGSKLNLVEYEWISAPPMTDGKAAEAIYGTREDAQKAAEQLNDKLMEVFKPRVIAHLRIGD